MGKLTLQLRTEDDLLDLLAKSESAAWVVEVRKELDEAYSWYESQQLGLGDDFLEQ